MNDSPKNRAVILAGSNMGDSLSILQQAKQFLSEEDCRVEKESSMYRTAAWGNTGQADFLNQAWLIQTKKNPQELLATLLSIEKKLGRVRIKKWEPRLLDLDILFFNDDVIASDELVIPHPHLHKRKFALVALAEIIPGWQHPVLKKTVLALLAEVNDTLEVTKIEA